MPMTSCIVPECTKPGTGGRGWCAMHYRRWRLHGDPGEAAERRSTAAAPERFWAKVNKSGPTSERLGTVCWEWDGAKQRRGYGTFGVSSGKTVLAHRYAYEQEVGTIPEGTELDHLCRNTRCVRPTHLDPVVHRKNVLRGASNGGAEWDGSHPNRAKTECKNGHSYTPENTRWHNGHRACKTCIRAANARYEQTRRR